MPRRTSIVVDDALLEEAQDAQAGLTVLHYDEDYERVGAITGQATEWVAERGSID